MNVNVTINASDFGKKNLDRNKKNCCIFGRTRHKMSDVEFFCKEYTRVDLEVMSLQQ